jgi:hypothetical protein
VSDRDLDVLIEAAVTPYRERDVEGRVTPPPAWWDLSPEAREELYRRQIVTRVIEKAFDAEGWSGTVRAVMRRIG